MSYSDAAIRGRSSAAILSIAVLVLTACLHGGDRDRTELSVFAASSLTEAFGAIEAAYEAQHPEVDVRLTFAGSQVLRLQLEQGARADVFASANEEHMRQLQNGGLVPASHTFAHNELVVVVPRSNPAGIERFDQLDQARRIVVGSEFVPIGAYTRMVLDRAEAELGATFASAVRGHIVSEENNVRLVRAKVELGEADAAIVYRTDARASDRLGIVPIPRELGVSARYSIGAVTAPAFGARGRGSLSQASGGRASGGQDSGEAERFIDFVRSAAGAEILRSHGFEADPAT